MKQTEARRRKPVARSLIVLVVGALWLVTELVKQGTPISSAQPQADAVRDSPRRGRFRRALPYGVYGTFAVGFGLGSVVLWPHEAAPTLIGAAQITVVQPKSVTTAFVQVEHYPDRANNSTTISLLAAFVPFAAPYGQEITFKLELPKTAAFQDCDNSDEQLFHGTFAICRDTTKSGDFQREVTITTNIRDYDNQVPDPFVFVTLSVKGGSLGIVRGSGRIEAELPQVNGQSRSAYTAVLYGMPHAKGTYDWSGRAPDQTEKGTAGVPIAGDTYAWIEKYDESAGPPAIASAIDHNAESRASFTQFMAGVLAAISGTALLAIAQHGFRKE